MKYIKKYKLFENLYRSLTDDEWDDLSEADPRNLCTFSDSEIKTVINFATNHNLEFYVREYNIEYLLKSKQPKKLYLNGEELTTNILENYSIELYGPGDIPDPEKKFIYIYKEDDEYYDVLINYTGKKTNMDGQWRCDQMDGLLQFLNDFFTSIL